MHRILILAVAFTLGPFVIGPIIVKAMNNAAAISLILNEMETDQ